MKKTLKYSGLVLFVIVITFFSLGIFIPSFEYENKVTVNKPIEQSFKIFNNVLKLSEWVPGFKGIRLLNGKQNEIGSKMELTLVQGSETYIVSQEITEFKENEVFAFSLDNDMLTNECKIKFINKGTSTEIISSNHITGKNIFWKSLFVFSHSYFKAQSKEMYDKLKEVIEISN
ncbi:MAG: SRPBCC family protein [Bacteroidetes bacterium]|nr:SRPBCC family protein [Bacteroidota bacterium]